MIVGSSVSVAVIKSSPPNCALAKNESWKRLHRSGMMNFSAFGGPFSGIHQFAAKFGHDTQGPPGAFATPTGINGNTTTGITDNHVQRYQTNGNHFNQNIPNVKELSQPPKL
ncbi:unnamed protein product [Ceratitis capitata]|uniref:(Mediterranean fruit fly) hypothetical protein n=1 Tax=Ceratitis capitata TaxID=7213 RepID=A0A811UBD9_CERCA|nr:unnamed protein product [Ceratitis capitata]